LPDMHTHGTGGHIYMLYAAVIADGKCGRSRRVLSDLGPLIDLQGQVGKV
jgi:hypothetical protein